MDYMMLRHGKDRPVVIQSDLLGLDDVTMVPYSLDRSIVVFHSDPAGVDGITTVL